MNAFDGLPPPLRAWLSDAVLPWSPTSARRIWSSLRAKGHSVDETLAAMNLVEQKTLARDKSAGV